MSDTVSAPANDVVVVASVVRWFWGTTLFRAKFVRGWWKVSNPTFVSEYANARSLIQEISFGSDETMYAVLALKLYPTTLVPVGSSEASDPFRQLASTPQ